MLRPLLFVAVLIGLAAPSGAADLRIALNEDPDLLDPAQGGSFVGREVFAAMCDKLIDIAPDMSFVPQLATGWSWSADRTALTVKLRDGVVFHDGTKLTGPQMTADYFGGQDNVKRMAIPLGAAYQPSDLKALVFDAYDNDGIYFLELRDRYACGWCEARENELTLLPHPLSPCAVERFEFPEKRRS